MAKLPVGYRSPFNKISSVKPSPAKYAFLANPAVQQGLLAAAPGIIGAVGSLFGRRRRRQEQRDARKNLEQAKKAFESIEYKNPYADLQNPYAENIYEDMTVDTQAADYLKEQQQQSQANILSNLKGVAGGSGVASLAQQMSNISAGQAKQASMQIAQQERVNQQFRLKGEQQKQKAQGQVDIAKMQGEATKRAKEQARIGALYGLGIERIDAADTARQTAGSNFVSGLGQAAGGVAGLYAPGGSLYGTDPFKPQGNYENEYQMGTTYDPNKDEFGNPIG